MGYNNAYRCKKQIPLARTLAQPRRDVRSQFLGEQNPLREALVLPMGRVAWTEREGF